MNVRSTVAVAGLAIAGTLGLAGPASAQAACDAYSQGCVEPPGVLDRVVTPPAPASTTQTRNAPARVVSTPATLPFTGGELVLVSALGLAAVGGGVALVVAGRRRSDVPTA